MARQDLSFWIPGQPIGKGRPRFARGRAYTPGITHRAELKVAAIASDAMIDAGLKPFTAPVSVVVKALATVALANPSQVTVTVTEYGNVLEETEKVNLASFSSIDTMIADALAYNAADTIDTLVANALVAGTKVKYGGSRTTTATLTASDVISTAMLRKAQTELLEGNAQPRNGDLYTLFIHPRQAFDLRAETGAGGFVDIHKYTTDNMGNMKERFEPGAIDGVEDVKLFYGHEEPIGKVIEGRETPEGYEIVARISDTPRGNEVYTLLQDDVLNR